MCFFFLFFFFFSSHLKHDFSYLSKQFSPTVMCLKCFPKRAEKHFSKELDVHENKKNMLFLF